LVRSDALIRNIAIDEATHAMAERVKPAAFLIKPFSRDSLVAAIRHAFATGRNHQ
jgi:hypothetical protein